MCLVWKTRRVYRGNNVNAVYQARDSYPAALVAFSSIGGIQQHWWHPAALVASVASNSIGGIQRHWWHPAALVSIGGMVLKLEPSNHIQPFGMCIHIASSPGLPLLWEKIRERKAW